MLIFLFSALLIVSVLAVIAARLLWKVRQLQQRQAAQACERRRQRDAHRDYLNNSVQVLALGIIDDQLSLTEAAIRISVLLDNLQVDAEAKQRFSAFFQLAEATAHIPILDAWKKLPAQQRLRYEKQRMAAEEKYGDCIVHAAKRIRGQVF
ncbi:MAG: DUF2489 domain-containing protein [Cellvibrionaceae bacterium]|nr:DUF2489 domain-containing protein [Cellvibrionaceae bacterium]